MGTEAPGSEGGEQGDWTQSHVKRPESGESTGSRVHTQRALRGGGGRADRGGEATLGTKADRTDTSHPARGSAVSGPLGYI